MRQTKEIKVILKEIDKRIIEHKRIMVKADLDTMGGNHQFDASARQREELEDLHAWITNLKP